MTRLTELDSIRGAAALWVFSYHVWQFGGSPECIVSVGSSSWNLLRFVYHGPAGVDLFMVLSGFCLFWPLTAGSRRDWDWREYSARRVRRILPAYYGAVLYALVLPLLLVGLVRALGWEANIQPIPSFRQILTHLLFVHTLFRDTWDGITGAFWSMGLEAQFYAVFPAVVWAWRRFGMASIAGVAAVSVLFRLITGELMRDGPAIDHFLVSITFMGKWMQFSAGMAAALFVRRTFEAPSGADGKLGAFLAAGGLVLSWAGLEGVFGSDIFVPTRDVVLAVGYALVLAGVCLFPRWIKSPLVGGPLPWLGKISYSFFLIHQPTAWYFMELGRKKFGFVGLKQIALGYSVGLVVAIACAAIFYEILEKPFIGSLKREPKRVSDQAKAMEAGGGL